MEDRKNEFKAPHSIVINERENIKVAGVTDVESFDENEITLYTSEGGIILIGEDFKINRLSVETGEVEIEGFINEIKYTNSTQVNGGFWSKIFK